MEKQRNIKARLIGALVAFVGLLIVWFLFKKTIVMLFYGVMMMVIVYAAVRLWLWRRRRGRRGGV